MFVSCRQSLFSAVMKAVTWRHLASRLINLLKYAYCSSFESTSRPIVTVSLTRMIDTMWATLTGTRGSSTWSPNGRGPGLLSRNVLLYFFSVAQCFWEATLNYHLLEIGYIANLNHPISLQTGHAIRGHGGATRRPELATRWRRRRYIPVWHPLSRSPDNFFTRTILPGPHYPT